MPHSRSGRLEKEKHFVPTWIRIPDHPANAIDPIITMLHRLPKFHPTASHEGLALATLPHAKKPCTYCKTQGSVGPETDGTGAENLLPTSIFKPQMVQAVASRCIHVKRCIGEVEFDSDLSTRRR